MSWPGMLADLLVAVHAAYIAFVVVGQAAIVAGLALGKGWARNYWLRIIHLLMILIVVAEAWLGIACPLTTWERELRRLAGQGVHEASFIGHWIHRLIFVRAEPWALTLAYTIFGLIVLATFLLGPPRRPGRIGQETAS